MTSLVVATWYAGIYVGRDLYCGGVYAETTQPWVALPIQDDSWQCGDLGVLFFEGETAADHQVLVARVMDTGPFGDNCVMQSDGSCLPIVADVPWHLWPDALADDLSALAVWKNITAQCREWGYCD